MHQNPLLSKAVQYLYGQGIISKDKDVADKLGYNKTTVSSYINGKVKASDKFNKEFERQFNVVLSDFKEGGKNEVIEKPDGLQLIAESILQVKAEVQTNRQLMIELLAAVKNQTVMEVQATANNLLEHNLARIVHELKQG